MRKGIVVILTIIALVLVGCEETTVKVISSRTTIYNFSVQSTFNSEVDDYVFTIDTVNRLIYNEDSMSFGTRVDSLIPCMTQTFVKAVIADSINLYRADTVYVDFTHPQKLTVTSSSGDTASYWITVNVHTVNPDSFIWRKYYDLGVGLIGKQKAVITDDNIIYWMMKSGSGIDLLSSRDGINWSDESVTGLPQSADVEHLIGCGDEICVLNGVDVYSYDGDEWRKTTTTSAVTLSHLLFTFRGEKYALGAGNVILKLVGTEWKTSAQLESGFPVSGECAFIGETVTGRPMAYVACGIDETGKYLSDVWSSENGSHWVKLNVKESVCTGRANAAVLQYGKGLLMIGGTNGDSIVKDKFLFSKDYGMTWQGGDTVYDLDTNQVKSYYIREGASMVQNDYGEIFVIGGRDSLGNVLGDVWRGLHYASIPGFEE